MSAASASARLELRARFELDDFPVDAAWSPDGRTLAVVGGEGSVQLLDIAAAAQSAAATAAATLGRHEGGALAVSWQPAGALFATSGQDGAVLLWDVRTRVPQRIHAAGHWVEHLAFAAHGRWLAAAAGKLLLVFDVTGAVRHRFEGHTGVIAAVAWRPRTHQVAAVGNGGAWIHPVETAGESRHYPWAGAALTASWSPDGRTLASGQQDGSVHLWYVAAGTQSQMKGYGIKVALTGWSGNGRYLATAAGDALVVWEFGGKGPEGRKPLDLRAHSDRIVALAFRPGGTWLVSTARDRRLLLWRVGHGEQPLDAQLLAAECSALRWSADGRWLAVADRQGGISLFEWRG